MDKLRAMRWFVQVVTQGSFSKVAEQTGVSKSMISKQISALEENLGARLLQRSTRRLKLTQTGQDYLARCRDILAQLDEAEAQVQTLQQTPKGRLKINAAMALGLTALAPAFAEFMRRYPQVELDVHLSDESLDLLEHNFDLGLRVASCSFDTGYVGKVIAHFDYSICASAAYLEQHGPIRTPDDLLNHQCFEYSYFRHKNIWPVGANGVPISGRLKANNSVFILDMVKQGLGVGFIPRFISHQALQSGEVEEVLAEEDKPPMSLYALYPVRHFAPPRLTLFIEFLQQWFAEHGYG
ncbi:LysR family transcriptional regulator [Aliiglaciecola sp. CAU 1673]|uniref:LysR family transcriptional regulator n=1 Tax=Aliiglaciecola sp. CAU 1673 TaxID=3032595 RepID=UPI0023DCDE2A|nr:LysR family transcriptional regulator [Aliiglaciecola sp. CAU 1673]MDF2180245.1 LysR family transcriptional regulator [Aliiglaciecola sp. CAU 1673]